MEKKKFPQEKSLRFSGSDCIHRTLCTIIVLLTVVIIGISILIYFDIKKASQKTRMECQVNYLQSRGYSDESFDSVGEYFGSQEWCAQRIIRKKYEIENETQERLNQVAGHRAYAICVVKRLKDDSNYINGILLLEILEYSRVSWRFWTFFERNSRYKILKNQVGFLETSTLNNCMGNNDDDDGDDDKQEIDGSGDGSGFSESDFYSENNYFKRSINYNNDDLYFDEN